MFLTPGTNHLIRFPSSSPSEIGPHYLPHPRPAPDGAVKPLHDTYAALHRMRRGNILQFKLSESSKAGMKYGSERLAWK